jgi:methyl-accepting chemotaxis protein
MEAPLISNLLNAGVGGLILIALFYFWKLKSVDQESLLTRIDKIVDRHLAAEESNRKQVADLSETNHTLFDRVITVCTNLGAAIDQLSANTRANERALNELSASTKANERAIQELRNEMRQIGGPPSIPQKSLGREDPHPPFGPG